MASNNNKVADESQLKLNQKEEDGDDMLVQNSKDFTAKSEMNETAAAAATGAKNNNLAPFPFNNTPKEVEKKKVPKINLYKVCC